MNNRVLPQQSELPFDLNDHVKTAQSASSSTSSSPSSSMNTTPSQTPTHELITAMMLEPSLSPPPTEQDRGRPRHKRRQPSRRYFTPPSRLPSPARPQMDLVLEVETMPQDPDIFADAETDYFSTNERHERPIAFRRHFVDALSGTEGPGKGMNRGGQGMSVTMSIDAALAAAN